MLRKDADAASTGKELFEYLKLELYLKKCRCFKAKNECVKKEIEK